jgi:hypothetical protein
MIFSILGAFVVLVCKLSGLIEVPGYTALILTIMFFGALTVAGLGIVGQYIWLSLQNTRARPNYLIRQVLHYEYAPENESKVTIAIPQASAAR